MMNAEPGSELPLLVSIHEAAHRIGIGRDRCYELVRRGELRSVLVGRRRRLVVAADLEAWINRTASEGAG